MEAVEILGNDGVSARKTPIQFGGVTIGESIGEAAIA